MGVGYLACNLHVYCRLLTPHFLYPLKAISMTFSIFLMMSLALERYIAVSKPLSRVPASNSGNLILVYIVPTIFGAFLLNLPKFFLFNVSVLNSTMLDFSITELRTNYFYITHYSWIRYICWSIGNIYQCICRKMQFGLELIDCHLWLGRTQIYHTNLWTWAINLTLPYLTIRSWEQKGHLFIFGVCVCGYINFTPFGSWYVTNFDISVMFLVIQFSVTLKLKLTKAPLSPGCSWLAWSPCYGWHHSTWRFTRQWSTPPRPWCWGASGGTSPGLPSHGPCQAQGTRT